MMKEMNQDSIEGVQRAIFGEPTDFDREVFERNRQAVIEIESRRLVAKAVAAGIPRQFIGATIDDLLQAAFKVSRKQSAYLATSKPLIAALAKIVTDACDDKITQRHETASRFYVIRGGASADHRRKVGYMMLFRRMVADFRRSGPIGCAVDWGDIITTFNTFESDRGAVAEGIKRIPNLYIAELNYSVSPSEKTDAPSFVESIFSSRARDPGTTTIISTPDSANRDKFFSMMPTLHHALAQTGSAPSADGTFQEVYLEA